MNFLEINLPNESSAALTLVQYVINLLVTKIQQING